MAISNLILDAFLGRLITNSKPWVVMGSDRLWTR